MGVSVISFILFVDCSLVSVVGHPRGRQNERLYIVKKVNDVHLIQIRVGDLLQECSKGMKSDGVNFSRDTKDLVMEGKSERWRSSGGREDFKISQNSWLASSLKEILT